MEIESLGNALREGLMAFDYGGSWVVGTLAFILGEMRNRRVDLSRDMTHTISFKDPTC